MRAIDLYNIGDTNSELQHALLALRQDFDAHNHDGASSVAFQTLRAETLSVRAVTIKKSSYSDTTAGLWVGLLGSTVQMSLGNATNYLQWTGSALNIVGSITATTGTIGGWIIGATTISSAISGERIVLDSGNKKVELINSTGSTVFRLNYGSSSSAAYQLISIQNDARRGIEFIVGSALGSDAKCITIDNPSTSICIDMTDAGGTAINIAGASVAGIVISHSGSGAGIDLTATNVSAPSIQIAGGSYPSIDITQNGDSTNSFGVRITQGTAGVKAGIFIDNNADSSVSVGMDIDRDGTHDNQVIAALRLNATNSGVGGKACGIDFTQQTIHSIMNVATDATDPTGGGGAATGRIPILVAGTLKYLAYY